MTRGVGVGIVATLCCATFGFALAAPAAATRSTVAESATSDIVVESNGDLVVNEAIRLRYRGGPFTRAQGRISLRSADDVVIESADAGAVVQRRGQGLRLTWLFAPVRDTTMVLSLRYRVRGALRADGHTAELTRVVFPERSYVIRNARTTLQWPAGWRLLEVSGRRTRVDADERRVVFTSHRLDKEHGMRLRAAFETPVVVAQPAWQQRADAQRQRVGVVAAASGAVLLTGLALLWLQRREAGPPHESKPAKRTATAPPANSPPVLLGALRHGRAGTIEAQACLSDLARRGYLDIETVRAPTRMAGGIYFLRRRSDGHDLPRWEAIVHAAAFEHSDAGLVRVDKAHRAIHGRLGEFRNAVRDELERRGALDLDAVAARGRMRATTWIWLGLVPAALAVAWVEWSRSGPGALLLAVAPTLVAGAAAITAMTIPIHSAAWGDRVAEAQAFRRHLIRIAKQRAPLETHEFEAWLPYAVVLGVAPMWFIASRRGWLPAPSWFPSCGTTGLQSVFFPTGTTAH